MCKFPLTGCLQKVCKNFFAKLVQSVSLCHRLKKKLQLKILKVCHEKKRLKNYSFKNGGYLRSPLDSSLAAVLTVSPNRQYLGIFIPTTPAQHVPAAKQQNCCRLCIFF